MCPFLVFTPLYNVAVLNFFCKEFGKSFFPTLRKLNPRMTDLWIMGSLSFKERYNFSHDTAINQ
ncbi:hypothetical protein Avbf_08233 [Armadillidium vulgare]|nr:hypothetical protein Avbf_08233 [Armadillidium vulgare]